MMSEKAKTTILNVDDDDAARYATSRILRKEGFEVLEASCGAEALRLAKQAPDLILLDVNLPDMGGFEVCRMIKEDPATVLIPVLHLSATYMDDLSKVKGLEAGADGYLTYPLEPPVLIAYINSLLRIGQTERKLEEAAQQWRTTFDAMKEAVSLMDKEQKFLQCNTSMKELVGKPFREIIGRYCWEVVQGTSEPIKGCPIIRMRETLRRETLVVPIGEQWIDVAVNPLLDGDGTLIGAVHIMHDITARKRAEEAVRESEAQKKAILDASIDRIRLDDTDMRIIWANQTYERDLDMVPEELVGKICYEVFVGRDSPCIECPSQKALKSGTAEHTVLTRPVSGNTDEKTYLDSFAVPIKDESGRIVNILQVTRNITEQVLAEKRLQESEEFNSALFEYNPIQTVVVDTEGRITRVNLAKKQSGDRQPAVGNVMYKDYAGKHEIDMHAELMECIKSSKSKHFPELKYGDKTLSITIAPFYKGAIIATLDITEQKRAQDNLTASLKEKEILLQEIHHRVKNNMQVISSLLKLQAETIQEETLRAPFRESEHRVRAMSLVHEKLYQSKDFTHIPFRDYLTSLIRYLYQSYTPKAGTIELVTEIEEIPLTITHAIPCGLIVNELLSNALKHAFPDHRTGTITIGLRSPEPQVYELTVSDNGIGLPEAIDLKTTQSLGLHLVSILVEDQLKGTIEVERTGGTRVRIRFRTKE
jgi:PAS domain S-box-containing protein